MQPLVSVIVPVYKVEEYLTRCLDSLCKQSLKNIEILLIDDASPDLCGKICEQYVVKDTRFKVIHHAENRGLSASRNTGIQHATANYIMFVDSDDWVHEDFCKIAYQCAIKYKAEIVMFAFERVKGYRLFGTKFKKSRTNESGFRNRKEAIKLMLNGVGSYFWNKLFQKTLFDDICLPIDCLYEDIGTIHRVVWKSNTIYYLDKALYYYFYRPNAITSLKTQKACNDWAKMNLQRIHDFILWDLLKADELEGILKNMALNYCIWRKKDKQDFYSIFFTQILLKSNIPINFTWKRKILFLLFKHSPALFDFVCNVSRRRGS